MCQQADANLVENCNVVEQHHVKKAIEFPNQSLRMESLNPFP